MADVSGLALTVLGIAFEVASTIYNYAKAVHGARHEIQQLSNELFALIGVLERMKRQQDEISSGKLDLHPKAFAQEDNQAGLRTVMQESLEFLQDLKDSLATPKSRFHARLQKLEWPLKESEVKQHVQRLERVKTYMILSLMTDEVLDSTICTVKSLLIYTDLCKWSYTANCGRDIGPESLGQRKPSKPTGRRVSCVYLMPWKKIRHLIFLQAVNIRKWLNGSHP